VSIEVAPPDPVISNRTTQQFTATGTYSDGTTQDVTGAVIWSSSGPAATISNAAGSNGLATAVAAGSATITATAGSISGSTSLTITAATLVSIEITPPDPTISDRSTKQFTATGTYSDGTTQDVTGVVDWSSSNTSAATISNAAGSKGLATAVAAGATTITATSERISGTTSLTITEARLMFIDVTPPNPSIANGTHQQFAATGIYSDGTTQDLTGTVTWSSSNTSVATISNAAGSRGLAASVAAGSTTIQATSGSISGYAALTITPATLVSIAITPPNPSIARGTTQQFAATGTYSDGTTQDLTGAVTWSSSNTSVATISNAAGSKGLATSVAAGSTTIKAASGSISGSTTLTITTATLVSIAITPANPSIAKGTTQQFVAKGTYSNNSTQILTALVTWKSTNTSIATISNAGGSKGRATAVAAGSTTIRATLGTISGSTTLTVTTATLVSVAITPANPVIATGTTQQFVATGTYSDNSTQNLTVAATWSSSNTSVATISNAAGSNGLATSVASGTTTITATSGGKSGSTTLTVIAPSPVTLLWDAPTTYSDGTTLDPGTAVAKYRIYYGTSSRTYTKSVDVVNSGATTMTYTLNLVPGTYFFAVTDIDISGLESAYSNEASRTI
jgi:trimeric autotransporter adhesin